MTPQVWMVGVMRWDLISRLFSSARSMHSRNVSDFVWLVA